MYDNVFKGMNVELKQSFLWLFQARMCDDDRHNFIINFDAKRDLNYRYLIFLKGQINHLLATINRVPLDTGNLQQDIVTYWNRIKHYLQVDLHCVRIATAWVGRTRLLMQVHQMFSKTQD